MTGISETDACPYAYGYTPQELECRLLSRHDKAVGVSWWRRLWRYMCGAYWCPNGGRLPCERFRDITDSIV